MDKGRLEAFSDGVIAILITIMVLELKVLQSAKVTSLHPLLPVFLSYTLSFIFLGIYWNNHHHLLQATEKVDGRVLWANLHFLFWLSFTPFVTGWMGENHFASWPVAAYGVVLLCAAIAYVLLTRALVTLHEKESALVTALRRDTKEKASMVLYILAIPIAFYSPLLSCGMYVLVAILWLIPDPRIEKKLTS